MCVFDKSLAIELKQNVRMIIAAITAPLVFSSTALAQGQIDAGCMEETAGFNVQCSANDIQIAGVASNPDGSPQLEILDDGCAYQGDTVEFTATFELVSSAKERHDIGIYFVNDGDPQNDGAVSGSCNISTLHYQPDPPWLDLDGTNDPFPGMSGPSGVQDTCGDIDKPDHQPLYPTLTLVAVCVDPDKDGKLNMPYCTSWRQSGANELCTSPTDAYPGSPSKCRCDEGFNVPIDVPPAEFLVYETVSPHQLTEPGGYVTYTVTVTNIGIDPNNAVYLSSLMDDIYGDITQTGHDGIVSTTCSVPQTIPSDDRYPGGIDTYSCQYTVAINSNANAVIVDTVTASGTDSNGNALVGSDSATVTLLDSPPQLKMSKSASPTQLLEPGGQVTFTVTVSNTSAASSDPITLNSLIDSIHGDINGQGTCQTGVVIASGMSYSCSFTASFFGNFGDSETDTVTASGTDDEGNAVNASDSETIEILDVLSTIEMTKTALPVQIDEPGGTVTYVYRVSNTSLVDTVTISVLSDDKLGDLNGQNTCSLPQTLPPATSYICSVTTYVAGNGNTSVTNVAITQGIDDDNEPVSAMTDATVNIGNLPPAASLTKTAVSAMVTYTVTVKNDSDAEQLTVTSLNDDMFGDVTTIQGKVHATTCVIPQVLQPATQPGDSYSCTFDALVNTPTHTNTVTGTIVDDDGSAAVTPHASATVTLQ